MGVDWSLLSKTPSKAKKTDSAPDVFSETKGVTSVKTGDLPQKPSSTNRFRLWQNKRS